MCNLVKFYFIRMLDKLSKQKSMKYKTILLSNSFVFF